jgi:hypothetical protein
MQKTGEAVPIWQANVDRVCEAWVGKSEGDREGVSEVVANKFGPEAEERARQRLGLISKADLARVAEVATQVPWSEVVEEAFVRKAKGSEVRVRGVWAEARKGPEPEGLREGLRTSAEAFLQEREQETKAPIVRPTGHIWSGGSKTSAAWTKRTEPLRQYFLGGL